MDPGKPPETPGNPLETQGNPPETPGNPPETPGTRPAVSGPGLYFTPHPAADAMRGEAETNFAAELREPSPESWEDQAGRVGTSWNEWGALG